MFDMTVTDGATTRLRVSFWQCVKAGLGFSLGAVALPAIATIIQAITKIPLASTMMLLRIIH